MRHRERAWPLPAGGFRLQASPILASGRSTESRPAAVRHKLPQQPASSTYIWWATHHGPWSLARTDSGQSSLLHGRFATRGTLGPQREGGKYKQANPNTLQFTPPIYSKRPGRYERMTMTPWRVEKLQHEQSLKKDKKRDRSAARGRVHLGSGQLASNNPANQRRKKRDKSIYPH